MRNVRCSWNRRVPIPHLAFRFCIYVLLLLARTPTANVLPMPSWPRAVLFDFDGVIVNSEPLHFHAFHEVLAEEQIELTEDEYYRELIGFDDKGAFKHVFQKHQKNLDPRTFLRVMTRKSEAMMELIH